MSAAGDDGYELFKKPPPPPPMRAVVTACGHGGIVSESEHVTRKTTTAATRTLQPEGFVFYVLHLFSFKTPILQSKKNKKKM